MSLKYILLNKKFMQLFCDYKIWFFIKKNHTKFWWKKIFCVVFQNKEMLQKTCNFPAASVCKPNINISM